MLTYRRVLAPSFLMYRNDSWRMKTLVAFLVSLNLVGCAADIYILWWQLIRKPCPIALSFVGERPC